MLALCEHWLWPYKLDQVSNEYEAVGKADSWLTDTANGGRGFGGVGTRALLQHLSVSGINSDHICGIRFSVDDGNASLISVIAVYLSCLDQGIDCYREHVLEFERLVTESEQLGPVAVLGDFNAHLLVGSLGGLRGWVTQICRVFYFRR